VVQISVCEISPRGRPVTGRPRDGAGRPILEFKTSLVIRRGEVVRVWVRVEGEGEVVRY
jgi:hypothetical protein